MSAPWQQSRLPDGTILTPPEGPTYGQLRLRQHVRPLQPMVGIVDEALASLGIAAKGRPLERRRLLTDHGEYAALARVEALVGWAPAELIVGAVFAEDFSHQVLALVRDEAAAPRFRDLTERFVRSLDLGLGAARHRRYFYSAPAEWLPLVRGLTTVWYPPGYPDDYAVLTVAPARPVSGRDGCDELVRQLTDSPTTPGLDGEPAEPESVTLGSGLEGERVRWEGPDRDTGSMRTVEVVRVRDASWTYEVSLDSGVGEWARNRDVLDTLLESIVPLPPLPGR